MNDKSAIFPKYEVRWHFEVYLWEMSNSGHGWIATDCVTEFGDSENMVILDKDFQAWGQIYLDYESEHDTGGEFADVKNFGWDRFNAKGVELAKRLKALLGPQQHIQYSKSIHDNDRHRLVWVSDEANRSSKH